MSDLPEWFFEATTKARDFASASQDLGDDTSIGRLFSTHLWLEISKPENAAKLCPNCKEELNEKNSDE